MLNRRHLQASRVLRLHLSVFVSSSLCVFVFISLCLHLHRVFIFCLSVSACAIDWVLLVLGLHLSAPRKVSISVNRGSMFSSIVQIQATLSERALELLALPEDGVPKLLLDIGCGSRLSGETLSENGHHWIGLDISPSMLNIALEQEVDGDLLLYNMGQVYSP